MVPRSRSHRIFPTVSAACGLSFPKCAYMVNQYMWHVLLLKSNRQIPCEGLFMYVPASAQLIEVEPLVLSVQRLDFFPHCLAVFWCITGILGSGPVICHGALNNEISNQLSPLCNCHLVCISLPEASPRCLHSRRGTNEQVAFVPCPGHSTVKAGNGLQSWEELHLCRGWSAILWQEGSNSEAVQSRAWHTGLTQQCHLTEKPIRTGLTSSQPKYSPAVFSTGDASRMEGKSRQDMIRNVSLIQVFCRFQDLGLFSDQLSLCSRDDCWFSFTLGWGKRRGGRERAHAFLHCLGKSL